MCPILIDLATLQSDLDDSNGSELGRVQNLRIKYFGNYSRPSGIRGRGQSLRLSTDPWFSPSGGQTMGWFGNRNRTFLLARVRPRPMEEKKLISVR
jgi:hypothetical protein